MTLPQAIALAAFVAATLATVLAARRVIAGLDHQREQTALSRSFTRARRGES